MQLSRRQKQILIPLTAIILLLGVWFSWRLMRLPEASQTALLPDNRVALLHVPHLGNIMDAAKKNMFLEAAVDTPMIQQFLKSRTWRYWTYQKQHLEVQLQSRIDERYVREVLGRHATVAFYPGSEFLLVSIASPIARLQVLWNEWSDLFYSHYDIKYTKYQGIPMATLTTQGGRFYYALQGRLGLLSSDQALLEGALDRYLARVPTADISVDSITTHVDFTRYPDTFPYADQAQSLPLRDWRSQTHEEGGRWISEHQFTLNRLVIEELTNTADLPTGIIPDDVALAGFLNMPASVLWEIARPYVQVQGGRPELHPYLKSGIEFALESSDHMLPALSIAIPTKGDSSLSQRIEMLHGKVSVGGKRVKADPRRLHRGVPVYPLSWAPALLVRLKGSYAITQDMLFLGNDTDLVQRQIDAHQQQITPLTRLDDLSGYDGALWLHPERCGPVLQQLARVTNLASLFSDLSLPWLLPLSQSTDPLKHLSEARIAFRAEGSMLTLRFEVASQD